MAALRTPLTLCLGGGGAFGVGFHMGVVGGMAEEGVDLRAATMMGTSAGAYASALIATGIPFERLADEWTSFSASLRHPLWVRTADLTDSIYGTATAYGVSSVAVRMLTFRRHVLCGDQHRLSDLVAASSSPIPFARPHRLGHRRYVDGGLRRMASADLAPAADVLLLLTPLAFRDQGFLGRSAARQLRKEIPKWTQATGGKVVHVTPSDEILALPVKRAAEFNDMELGRRVYDLSVPIGRETARQLRLEHPGVVEWLIGHDQPPAEGV